MAQNQVKRTVLMGGRLIDGTGKPPIEEAVVIIRENIIEQVGIKSEINIPNNSKIIDLSGKTITPGFIDSHCHFFFMSIMANMLNLNDTKSLREALSIVEKKVSESQEGEWIAGYGWDESKWPENRYITTEDLNTVSLENPVVLVRVCGHMRVFNTAANQIIEQTELEIDTKTGETSLNVNKNIMNLINLLMPESTLDDFIHRMEVISVYALSQGCTSVHDPGLDRRAIQVYQKAKAEGVLLPRAYLMVMAEAAEAAEKLGLFSGFGDDLVQIGSVKFWLDGSLGSRTAALSEPYSDDPSNLGSLALTESEYYHQCLEAHRSLMQTSTHAIGDRTIKKVLDVLETVIEKYPRDDHRHRIEHCELLSEEQVNRIKNLGVVASMQPNFVGAWSILQPMYQQRIGEERMRWCNPYRQLLDAGVTVAFGSDGMPFGPMFGIWSAVNHPIVESRISLVEAVKCYTLNGAYAAFQEDVIGSVEVGKLADIAVFGDDMTKVPLMDLHKVKCEMTFLNGKEVYKRSPSPP